MKESAKILIVVMVIIFGFAAIANTIKRHDTLVQIVACDMGVFKLVYLKTSLTPVMVGILNEKGEVIQKEEVDARGGFLNKYDLRKYGSGEYTFRIQDSTGQMDNTVFYDAELNMAICQMGSGKYKLVMEGSEDVDINVFDEDQKLLVSDNFHNRGSLNKVYDFSKQMESESEVSFMIRKNKGLLKIATF